MCAKIVTYEKGSHEVDSDNLNIPTPGQPVDVPFYQFFDNAESYKKVRRTSVRIGLTPARLSNGVLQDIL